MSIKKYRAFIKTVELGSLTKAAEELGYTQSCISHMLSYLERELDASLLIRSRSGVRLTSEGERLFPLIKSVTEADDIMLKEAESLKSSVKGTLRVGAFTSVAVHWLPGIIKEFTEAYPSAEFSMFNGDYFDVEQWLLDGEIDVGFISLPAPSGCDTVTLSEDRLLVIMPKSHRLSVLDAIPVESVAEEPFITLPQTSDHDIHRALDKAGIKPNVKYTTKDDYALIAMVAQGLGISVVPELLLMGRHYDIDIKPLEPPASRTIALSVKNRAQLSASAAKFIDFTVDWVERNVHTDSTSF